jgi:hypothetical protein
MRLVKVLLVSASFAAVFVLSSNYLLAQHSSTHALPAQGASAQPPDSKVLQTARQALIEILTGRGDASKHLTVEVQNEMQKKPPSGVGFSPTAMLAGFHSVAGPHFKTFDAGQILLSASDPKTHERIELQVDSDDLNADQDTLQLSVHQFRDEKEIETPFQFISQISVGMKKQANIWRLNEIAVGAKFPVGDPALFRKFNEPAGAGARSGGEGMYAIAGGASPESAGIPKRDIQTTLSLLSIGEQMYASRHPDQGFTCSLPDLLAEDSEAAALGLDPQIKTGIFDGFRISASGCQGLPVGSYQIVAEPLLQSAGSKAFCTDATHNIRQSDDGRGSTCLASGRVPSKGSIVPDVHTHIVVTH